MDTNMIYRPDDTICALCTPAGSGALAVIRISGKQVLEILSLIWKGKSPYKWDSHTAHLGYIIDNTTREIIDQCVATYFKAPNSFTGEDTVEISVHGSRWIQRTLLNLLQQNGVRMALPGEFTQRAYLHNKVDLAEAEAVSDLIGASSKAAHRMAMHQLRGHYSDYIRRLREELIELSSLVELELDFSEEDVEFASRQKLLELSQKITLQLSKLADSYKSGSNLKDGIPVSIIGKPNSGKSTLLNALLGEDRAIVSEIPGTTRDIIEDSIEVGEYRIRFQDTAGIRQTDDIIETQGIKRTFAAAKDADIVLYLADLTTPVSLSEIKRDLSGLKLENILIVLTKCDLTNNGSEQTYYFDGIPSIKISAKEGSGLTLLLDTIKRRLDSKYIEDGEVIINNIRHAEALRLACEASRRITQALEDGIPIDFVAQDLRETIHHLGRITGEISSDNILASIFSKFCIGK